MLGMVGEPVARAKKPVARQFVWAMINSDSGGEVVKAAIPLFGPFVLAGSAQSGYVVPLVVNGILQNLAAALFITGVAITRRVPVVQTKLDGGARLTVLPAPFGNGGFGVSATITHF